jgi:DNA-binding NtrC family response regulator
MDVAPLANHFLQLYASRNRSSVSGFSADALAMMAGYDWPGNVRELENLVQGALVLKRDGLIEVSDIERRLRFKPGQRDTPDTTTAQTTAELPEDGLQLRETLEELEREFIRQALRRSEGNKAQAAGLLGMNRTTLVEKLKRHPVSSS